MAQQLQAHPDFAVWRQHVRYWFPHLHQRAYFVPPVHFNAYHLEEQQVSGGHVWVTQPPVDTLPRGAPWALQTSQVRDDQTQQRILHCLRALVDPQTQEHLAVTDREPMIVMSQLQYGDYLGERSYAAAARLLPSVRSLASQRKRTHAGQRIQEIRGDFDLLLLHLIYGLITVEVKAVGDNEAFAQMSPTDQDDLVVKKVSQAVAQLQKSADVLGHLVSDLQAPPPVRKVLAVPNIARSQLRRALARQPQVRQVRSNATD